MFNKIPISIISKPGRHVIYFDPMCIENLNNIESAYIDITTDCCNDMYHSISASLNDCLTDTDISMLSKQEQLIGRGDHKYKTIVDISEAVKMIASGHVENKGILLENIKYLCNPRLRILYYPEKIYPCRGCLFFEKELIFISYSHRVESPWFFSGLSDTITFFVHNKGKDIITIHIENSPNAIRDVKDAQRILVHPNETVDIIPYKFSKFMRLVVDSSQRKVDCKIWIQMQQRN